MESYHSPGHAEQYVFQGRRLGAGRDCTPVGGLSERRSKHLSACAAQSQRPSYHHVHLRNHRSGTHRMMPSSSLPCTCGHRAKSRSVSLGHEYMSVLHTFHNLFPNVSEIQHGQSCKGEVTSFAIAENWRNMHPPFADPSHPAGNPKGVVLTHTNVLSTVVAMQTYCRESDLDYSSNDNVLSYLTMAHILGRVVEEFALSCGASIGYWQACNSDSVFIVHRYSRYQTAVRLCTNPLGEALSRLCNNLRMHV